MNDPQSPSVTETREQHSGEPLPESNAPAAGDLPSRYRDAVSRMRSGNPAEALHSFDTLLRHCPTHPGARLGRGLALHAVGERMAALMVFREIAAGDPSAWKAWNSVADITPVEAERVRALEAASAALVRLCAAADAPGALIGACADALMAAMQPAEAAAQIRESGTAHIDPGLGQRLARALSQQGRFADAFREACCVLARTHPLRRGARSAGRFAPQAAIEVLAEIQTILSGAGISSFLAAGTLLGFYRNGRPLAHDRDIDIGVLRTPDGGPDIAAILRTHPALLLPRIARPGDRYFGLQHKGVSVDIFVHDEAAGSLVCGFSDLPGDIQWRFSRFGLARADYGGRQWTIPSDPARYLEETYGAGWRIPDAGFASAVSSPALSGTSTYARAYVAVMRAITARRLADIEKASALIRQSPLPVPGAQGAPDFVPPTDGTCEYGENMD